MLAKVDTFTIEKRMWQAPLFFNLLIVNIGNKICIFAYKIFGG